MKTWIKFNTALVWILAFLVLLLIFPYAINAQSDIGPLLPEDLLISDGQHLSGRTNVAFDGTKYLVVWTQLTDPFTTRFDVYGRFVDTAGEALAPPFRIGWTAIDDVMPDVAFNGDYFLVVWVNLLELRCQVVGTDGQLIGEPLLISDTFGIQKREPALSTDGSEFLVVWREFDVILDSNNILGQFVSVDQSGNASFRGNIILVSTPAGFSFAPSIAYGIASYLVTWNKEHSSGIFVYGVLVGLDASVAPLFGLINDVDNVNIPAEIAFDGTNYLIVYNKGSDLYGMRVTSTGTPIDAGGFLISPNASHGNVAFGDGEYLVVWGGNEIMGTRVSTKGEVLDSSAVDLSVMTGAEQSYPALAFDGENYLVTWEQGAARTKYAQLVGLTDQSPEEMLDALIDAILLLNEEYNIANSFDGKLESALAALQDANDKNDISAINRLNAFITTATVQRDLGHIDAEDIDPLIAAAQAIIDGLESQ